MLLALPGGAAFVSALCSVAATEAYAGSAKQPLDIGSRRLFIGGSWLAASASPATAGRQWAQAGRRALERSVGRPVVDGSSPNTLTYHRLLLDTLTQLELWRNWLNLVPFSSALLGVAAPPTG